jgi:putative nucleotidyltransferase with HDIG domain
MGEKSILLADADLQVIEQFRQTLGESWHVQSVDTVPSAVAELKRRPYDVLVAGLDLGGVSGAKLLNEARRKHPGTMRFVLASESDKPRVMKEVLGAHRFLSKPLDLAALKGIIEGAAALDSWIASDGLRALVARVRTFPALPDIYLELLSVLRSPDATTGQVAELIAKDMAMTTKLLQVLNSAYFGLPNKITDLAEAVGILGFETVKSMVMAIKLLGQYDRLKPGHFSIDQLWRHSTEVARNAKQIVLMHGGGCALAETAFTAGLMHDIGKVVLASNFNEQYRGAQSLATNQNLPLWEVEKEIFGASHGEVGAYLLGLWGMPREILEVAALHHTPRQAPSLEFSAVTAVHVANILEREVHPNKDDSKTQPIDEGYLTEIGVQDCLPSWREAVRAGDFTLPEVRNSVKLEPAKDEPVGETTAETPPEIVSLPKADQDLATGTSGGDLPACALWTDKNRRWAYMGAIAAILVLLAVLAPATFRKAGTTSSEGISTAKDVIGTDGIVEVRAKTLPPQDAPTPAQEETTTASEPPVPETTAPAEMTPATQALAEAPKPPTAEPPMTGEPLPATLSTTEAPKVTPAEANTVPSFPEIKLQGLILSSQKPVALLNGKMLFVNDSVAGARVISIGHSNVVLEYQNQRRTLNLK